MDFPPASDNNQEDKDLPQCKIKRNYTCNHCLYFTQNPRFYLTHLRDIHGERLTLNNCSLCLYASRHYQKLVRHMKMVHGSTAEGIPGQSRKRPMVDDVVPDSIVIPPLPSPPEWIIDIDKLSYDLKSSRKTLKDLAAIYFAENDVDEILAKMEASDVVEVVPVRSVVSVSTKTVFGDPKSFGDSDLDIICECGHISKCFLDSIIHGKSCCVVNEKDYESTPLDLSIKSSNKGGDSILYPINDIKMEQQEQDNSKNYQLEKFEDVSKNTDKSLTMDGYELSTELIWKPEQENHESGKEENHDEIVNTPIKQKEEPPTLDTHRKVFKCPLCSFWASTASRFHVHIVGHQNKKSFKCSLCSYCSNWRWDISKHIRVRTIRSPSHRNARVVMHGEIDGGRRNYAKYDKYITLLKISEQDDDLKFKRCGELLLNDEDKNDFKENPTKEKIVKTSNLPEVVQNKKKTQNKFKDLSPRDYLAFEDGDKPCYKCSICYFRHPNRDAVLVHVKFQHHDLLTSSMISPKSEKPSAERCQNLKKVQIDEIKSLTETKNDAPMNDVCDSMFIDVENDDNMTVSRKYGLRSKKPAADQLTSPLKESLETSDNKVDVGLMARDKASSSKNSQLEIKIAAAFRCWHCHQISNWKHVIQRHCRLKHSGSIRIETIDRSLDIKNPIYRMLNFSSNSLESSARNGAQLETKKDKSLNDEKNANIKNDSIDSDKEHEIYLSESNKISLNINQTEQKLSKFECMDCSFVSTNEVELNKHSAKKHKPSSTVHNKSKKSCNREVTAIAGGISDKNIMKPPPEKCPFCSFENSCQSTMIFHKQSHNKASQACKSDIKEENASNSNQSKEVVAKRLNFNDLNELNGTDSTQKEYSLPITETASLKKSPQFDRDMDKIDKEPQPQQQSKTSSVNANNLKYLSTLPAASPKKTIFVNPKTGKIVRRN